MCPQEAASEAGAKAVAQAAARQKEVTALRAAVEKARVDLVEALRLRDELARSLKVRARHKPAGERT